MRKFYKYTALGNDMIVIDPAQCNMAMSPDNIRRICDRHFGTGADGICYGPHPDSPLDVPTMRFFNPDGSEAEKSGNGMRIFARYLWDAHYVTQREFNIGINNEVVPVRVLNDLATEMAIGMGQLSFARVDEEMVFDGEVVRATAVSWPNKPMPMSCCSKKSKVAHSTNLSSRPCWVNPLFFLLPAPRPKQPSSQDTILIFGLLYYPTSWIILSGCALLGDQIDIS